MVVDSYLKEDQSQPLNPGQIFLRKFREWRQNNPLFLLVVSPVIAFLIFFSIFWAVIVDTHVAAVLHLIVPMIAIRRVHDLYILAICLTRSITFGVVYRHLRYPSTSRRLLSFMLSISETCMIFAIADTSNLQLKTGAITTSWLMFIGELWMWTTERHLEQSEQRLLHLSCDVPFESKVVAGISTLIVNPDSKTNDQPVLVCCHGYAAGKALYGTTLKTLSQHYRVYCIDWLGFGRSSRRSRLGTVSVEATEKYFVDSLENWRMAMGITKFHLLGHSMGGYLCAVYAIHYCERVQHLFLISPVGLPDGINPFTLRSSRIVSFIRRIWDFGFTPMAILRIAGPFGPYIARHVSWMRFGAFMTRPQAEAIGDYVYHLNAGPLVGDLAISRLLHVGAWPRVPLGPRLAKLSHVPLTFMYGLTDWMDRNHATPVLDGRSKTISAHCRLYVIPDAGHQVYLMNPQAFAAVVLRDGINVGPEILDATTDDGIIYYINTSKER
uniref:AB hydrolase-1 domain-containing protein n=1 Tax=Spongospora subterranea TaxID=70186 RepID=A0A0H5QH88_9EUKA|eukprot:CRZ01360.1 hypothetical protein [Spongospora subterranea]